MEASLLKDDDHINFCYLGITWKFSPTWDFLQMMTIVRG